MGGDELVETKRGAKFKDIKIKTILIELRGDERLPEVNYMVGVKRKKIVNEGVYVGSL